MNYYSFILVNFFSLFCIMIMVQCKDSDNDASSTNRKVMFQRLFKLQRAEQLNAVKKMRTLQEDKQQKMVQTVAKTVFDVIQKSKAVLEQSGYIPGVSEFPEKETVRDALSLVLENTALMGDLILRLPDVTEPVLRSTPVWPTLLAWSLNFSNETQLLDNSTSTLIHLVEQELNFTSRHLDYINPYRKAKDKSKVNSGEESHKNKKKKRSPLPRGPRMSSSQTGEL